MLTPNNMQFKGSTSVSLYIYDENSKVSVNAQRSDAEPLNNIKLLGVTIEDKFHFSEHKK